jgi:hypothetical protein
MEIGAIRYIDYELLSPKLRKEFREATSLPCCLHLRCRNSFLTCLPNLPNCLAVNCRNNLISVLPDLPLCEDLVCSNNLLLTLPPLPCCRTLECDSNRITTLPNLPECRSLSCRDNGLHFLPCRESYDFLDCRGNYITHANLLRCEVYIPFTQGFKWLPQAFPVHYTRWFACLYSLKYPSPAHPQVVLTNLRLKRCWGHLIIPFWERLPPHLVDRILSN